MNNFTAKNVKDFLESWGLHFDSSMDDSTTIPYPQVYLRMKRDADDVGGDKLSRFISQITDTTDSQTYLTPNSWSEVAAAWDTFQ